MSVFDFDNYRKYLQKIVSQQSAGRGFQSRLALAAKCQPSYLSQALKGKAQLSSDQILAISNFLNLSTAESEFLLNLLYMDKAGTSELKDFYVKRNAALLDDNKSLGRKLNLSDGLSKEESFQYYSDWVYAAVHIILTIPCYRNPAAIAKRLSVSVEKITRVLNDLKFWGLAKVEQNAWQCCVKSIHASEIFHKTNHKNWRNQCIAKMQVDEANALHYTDIVSLSLEDFRILKAEMTSQIKKFRDVTSRSNEEELFFFLLDFAPA